MAKAEIITVARSYVHRTFGAIGTVRLTAPNAPYTLDGATLPPQSVEHLLTFALQTLQDAYAGAEDAEDAVARFNGKLERLIAGTLGTRSGGAGVTPLQAAIRAVLRPLYKDALGAEAYKAQEEADRMTAIDALFDGMSDDDKAAVTSAAESKMAADAAEAAAKAGLKGLVKVKL